MDNTKKGKKGINPTNTKVGEVTEIKNLLHFRLIFDVSSWIYLARMAAKLKINCELPNVAPESLE